MLAVSLRSVAMVIRQVQMARRQSLNVLHPETLTRNVVIVM